MGDFKTTLFIGALKLINIKKDFKRTPFQPERLRKKDVKQTPRGIRNKFTTDRFTIANTTITAIHPSEEKKSSCIMLYIPGGAFVSGPTTYHWQFIKEMVSKTGIATYLIDYPKAPEIDIHTMNANLDAIYAHFSKDSTKKIVLIGDSVGANLILSLNQRLIQSRGTLPVQNILITPVCDASMTNPEIDLIEPTDPILSKSGVLASKLLCANGIDLKDPIISPLYGSFNNFPDTLLFIAGRDIMYPDGKLLAKKMIESGVNLETVDDPEIIHIWPILPIMTPAVKAREKIVRLLNAI